MKGKFLVVVLAVMLVLTCAGCKCKHETWIEATCSTPKTCADCEYTEGEPLTHEWKDATCTEAKTCKLCNETEGAPAGHEWMAATCTEPKTCTKCEATEGEVLAHKLSEATCTEAATCVDCGYEEGDALGHAPGDWVETLNMVTACTETTQSCTVCGEDLEFKEESLTTLIDGTVFAFTAEEFTQRLGYMFEEYGFDYTTEAVVGDDGTYFTGVVGDGVYVAVIGFVTESDTLVIGSTRNEKNISSMAGIYYTTDGTEIAYIFMGMIGACDPALSMEDVATICTNSALEYENGGGWAYNGLSYYFEDVDDGVATSIYIDAAYE